MAEETTSEWCARTWNEVVPEYGQVHRWVVEGCSPPYDTRWEHLEEIPRPPSWRDLERSIERAIGNNRDMKQYRVRAWLPGLTKNHHSKKSWPAPESDDSNDLQMLNGSPQSMLAQLQQFTLAQQRLLLQTERARSQQSADLITTLTERVKVLEAERHQYLEAIESREDQQAERLLRVQKAEQWSNAVGALISVARAKFLGTPQQGERGEALSVALQDFFQTLSEKQLDDLMTKGVLAFRPEQLAALVTLMKGHAIGVGANGQEFEETKSLSEAHTESSPSGPVSREALLAARQNLTPEEYASVIALLRKALGDPTSQ